VPLTPYLGDGVFDPKAIEAMMAAFESIRVSMQLADRNDPLIEIVARAVIEVASAGERDPSRIHDAVLLKFRSDRQGA
jgi:hypothetical protein